MFSQILKKMGQHSQYQCAKATFATVSTNFQCNNEMDEHHEIKSLIQVKLFHAHMILIGTGNNILRTKLVNLYSGHGYLETALQLFEEMSQRNVFAWTEIIAGLVRHGYYEDTLDFYYQMQMQEESVQADHYVYPKVLKACAKLMALQEGVQLHASIVKTGYESNVYVGNALMDMYTKCATIEDARHVFDKIVYRNRISWNTMIAGYAQRGHIDDVSKAFMEMQVEDLEPDVTTWNTMITSYAQSGQCGEALGFFRQMQQQADMSPNVISWTAMIAGYSQNGLHDKALEFFHEMQQAGVKADSVTISNVLSACAHVAALQKGKEIHGYIVRNTFEFHSSVCSALVAMYSACGRIAEAHMVFDQTTERARHLVLWNSMIAGYSQNGHNNHALKLFRYMQMECVRPDSVTMASMLPACAGMATLKQGKEIHAYVFRSGLVYGVLVQNALIDMYAKCGSIRYARLVFDNISERDVVSWTVMIAGYGMHGFGEDVVSLFCQMQQAGMNPNLVTFTCVMSACSHTGLVDEGLEYFNSMTRDLQIKPSMETYACMVDLLGRAGRLDDAQKIIESMPFQPNACLWGALLGACRMHSNIQVGEYAAKQLYKLEPENAANYVLMSNMYAAVGRWNDVAKVRKMMEEAGLKKAPGCSWIEVKNRVHTFVQGEESPPQADEIYAVLDSLAG